MARIKIAIAGVGNCASALVQGISYYSEAGRTDGLAYPKVGRYSPADIEVVAAFDVDERKVGLDLSKAIGAKPNNTPRVCDVEETGVRVVRGPKADGIGTYLRDVVPVSREKEADVPKVLEGSGAEILVNYLPVGSTLATRGYAAAAIRAGAAFVNAIPVFIASDRRWSGRFARAGLPVAGDDVMSQVGATVFHKTIVRMCVDRGARVDQTYQLNIGGDTDFLNMQEEKRLRDKRESKTSAVRAMTPYEVPTRIGPSDYVSFLENSKVCYVWVKGRYFGGMEFSADVKLRVVDAFDSAGVMVDAIRGTKLALDRGVRGELTSVSAYCFKHPPSQMPYTQAKAAFEGFTSGKLER